MKRHFKFTIQSLGLLITCAGLAFAWWADHQRLQDLVSDAQTKSKERIKQNIGLHSELSATRNKLRASQQRVDNLFAKTINLEDEIKQHQQILKILEPNPISRSKRHAPQSLLGFPAE